MMELEYHHLQFPRINRSWHGVTTDIMKREQANLTDVSSNGRTDRHLEAYPGL